MMFHHMNVLMFHTYTIIIYYDSSYKCFHKAESESRLSVCRMMISEHGWKHRAQMKMAEFELSLFFPMQMHIHVLHMVKCRLFCQLVNRCLWKMWRGQTKGNTSVKVAVIEQQCWQTFIANVFTVIAMFLHIITVTLSCIIRAVLLHNYNIFSHSYSILFNL